MTFNIHNQQANVINQAAGNQYITGGQHVTTTTLTAARDAVVALRHAVATVPLNHTDASSARLWVDEIHAELHRDQPSAPVVETRLQRLTLLLKSAGALVAAGAPLLAPLQTLAGWLGQLGETTLRLLA